MTLLHRLAHLLGWNFGRVVSAYDRRGNLWMARKCDQCGHVSGKGLNSLSHPAPADAEFKA